jgi:hypothetical protein
MAATLNARPHSVDSGRQMACPCTAHADAGKMTRVAAPKLRFLHFPEMAFEEIIADIRSLPDRPEPTSPRRGLATTLLTRQDNPVAVRVLER